MMKDEIAAVRQSLARFGTAADLSELRSLYDAEGARLMPDAADRCRPVVVADRAGEWQGVDDQGAVTVYYLHGGGYTIGSLTSHRHIAGALADSVGGRSFAIDYRLAPEHIFPSPLADALAGYDYLLETGVAPGTIAIVGDSAGGNLAVQLLLLLRDSGRPAPACAVLFSPWIDLEATGQSMTTKATVDPVINREASLATVPLITGGGSIRTLGLVPLETGLDGLPPLLIQVGTHETLLDDAVRLAAKAAADNVDVTLEAWPGMVHVWQFYHPILREGADAIRRAGDFIRRHCA